MVLDPGELWPVAPKQLIWGQIWQLISDSPIHCASSLFCRSRLSVLVWARDRLKQSTARLTKKCEFFALMTSFDLENNDLGSQNLYDKEFLCGPTHSPIFVFLAFLGAEIAGGRICLPSRARNSQTLSRGRVNHIVAHSSVCFSNFGGSSKTCLHARPLAWPHLPDLSRASSDLNTDLLSADLPSRLPPPVSAPNRSRWHTSWVWSLRGPI